MILEIKVPETLNLSAILSRLPYFVSYAVGYVLIGVGMYHHHFIFSNIRTVGRKIYWLNNFWIFTTSFLPLATAWLGRGLEARGPAIFYAIVFYVWTLAFYILCCSIINTLYKKDREKQAHLAEKTPIYAYLSNPRNIILQLIATLLALVFYPGALLLIVMRQIMIVGTKRNPHGKA